jgi:hypothetical protein
MPKHKDIFGRVWDIPKKELCPTCGQPDTCGDCNHKTLTDSEAKELGVLKMPKKTKLDVGHGEGCGCGCQIGLPAGITPEKAYIRGLYDGEKDPKVKKSKMHNYRVVIVSMATFNVPAKNEGDAYDLAYQRITGAFSMVDEEADYELFYEHAVKDDTLI